MFEHGKPVVMLGSDHDVFMPADFGHRIGRQSLHCISAPGRTHHGNPVRRDAPGAGGVNQQAIAAIENALLDVKAKALGIPVYSLFGGPVRQKLPLYWSHCGGYRVRNPDILGVDPVPQQTVDANVERPALYRFLPKISLDSWRCRRDSNPRYAFSNV